MYKERLLRLADLLEADAANPSGVKFDLGTWAAPAGVDRNNPLYLYSVSTESIPLDCNTAACAMGLAALSGAFAEDGLGWHVTEVGYMVPTFRTKYGVIDGFEAAEALFGIEYREAEHLFESSYYRYPAQTRGREGELAVAKRIRDFVAGRYTVEPI